MDDYRNISIAYSQAIDDGDARRANQALDALLSIRRALRKAGPEHARKLLGFLDDDIPSVRLSAAIDAIEFAPTDAERVLTELAEGPPGMVRFEAEMTLKYWNKGEFTVPWWED